MFEHPTPAELIARYPYMFRGDRSRLDFCSGWMTIFSQACAHIDVALGPDKRGFHWVQIKEKFGCARFYYSIDPLRRGAAPTRQVAAEDDPLRLVIGAIKMRAETETATACMVCGAPTAEAGFSEPLCERHLPACFPDPIAWHEAVWIAERGEAAWPSANSVPPALASSESPAAGNPRDAAVCRVFLDDLRPAPPGWRRVYWPDEAIALLQTGQVTHISLDHDLGDDARGTGYDVLCWIEEAVALRGFQPPEMSVHSANPPARTRMLARIGAIERIAVQNQGGPSKAP